jgi:hypothetical protein
MGVFVLGMHRSGTSAVTRAINLLGVPIGHQDDLKEASEHNPKGFWEVRPLSRFNEELLGELGGTWSAPPSLADAWFEQDRLSARRDAGASLFRRLHPAGQWVWKDPRNCITLPFWQSALGIRPTVVLVHRHPLEIWRSLEARDGFSKPLALAAWERYLRHALANSAGLKVMVMRYTDLLSSPASWHDEARRFLEEAGIACNGAGRPELEAFLDRGLRHASVEDEGSLEDPAASPEQRELFAQLERLCGRHDSLERLNLPEETGWAEPLLAERRRADLEIEPLRFRAKRLDIELRVERKRLERQGRQLEKARRRVSERESALQQSREAMSALERSLSWRLTRPLRRLGRALSRRT